VTAMTSGLLGEGHAARGVATPLQPIEACGGIITQFG